MDTPIIKTYVDEHGNISVRVSHDVQVLTREETDRIKAEYRRMQTENAKLQEQMNLLVTSLRNDCDINASWDGLRKFWHIGLTENGCLMRDRACKAEAENTRLRELVRDMWHDIPKSESCGWDMSTNTCTGSDECIGECSYWYRMRELGVKVDA